MDENSQIRKVLQGNTSAFNYFVLRYQDLAFTIAFRVVMNKEDAEDIVQESFVKAYHNLTTFQQKSKFSTWLYRIVYTTAIGKVRTQHHQIPYADYQEVGENTLADWDTILHLEAKERVAQVNQTLEQLPPEDRVLLTLYYLEESSVKEIVAITGHTTSNIKVKLYRARIQFMNAWKKQNS